MIEKLHLSMARSRRNTTLIGAFIGFVAMNILLVIFEAGFSSAISIYQGLQPREAFFDYQNIEYVKRDAAKKALIFKSTSIIYQSYPIWWDDILRCLDGEEYHFVSSQNTNDAKPSTRSDYRTLPWDYSKEFPTGQTCYLESTITMKVGDHDKVQVFIGDEFKVE